MALLIGRRERRCLAPQGPFCHQAKMYLKPTLCLFAALSRIRFFLLSDFLSVAYFYSHKLINIFVVYLPASTHDFSCFLLLPLFICHAVSLQSRTHFSENQAFSPSSLMLTMLFLFFFFSMFFIIHLKTFPVYLISQDKQGAEDQDVKCRKDHTPSQKCSCMCCFPEYRLTFLFLFLFHNFSDRHTQSYTLQHTTVHVRTCGLMFAFIMIQYTSGL